MEEHRENPSEQDENRQQTQPTYDIITVLFFPTGGIGCPQLPPTQLPNWKFPEGNIHVQCIYTIL